MSYICKECEKEFSTIKGLGSHRFQKHGIKPHKTYNEYVLDGEQQKCKCGCGEIPKFLSITKGYRDYIWGHQARISNNWGHNPEAQKKSKETQREMYQNGELVIWNKGLTKEDPRVKDNIEKITQNPERNRKISEALTGRETTEEAKQKLREKANKRWSDPKEREKQRHNRLEYFKSQKIKEKSQLEYNFEKILDLLNIEYENQFRFEGYLFDFKIKEKNILIEVDGDFFHCNPDVHGEPKYDIQENTINNDKNKNTIVETSEYKLLRFWENDINNNPDEVIKELKQHIV